MDLVGGGMSLRAGFESLEICAIFKFACSDSYLCVKL